MFSTLAIKKYSRVSFKGVSMVIVIFHDNLNINMII